MKQKFLYDDLRSWLEQAGFNWGQGYLFGRPLPLDQVPEGLRVRSGPGSDQPAG